MQRITKGLVVFGFLIICNIAITKNIAQAATPPDNCFDFSAGTIISYYDYESNDNLNPACPKDVDIPSLIGGIPVTIIGNSAFEGKDLISVTIPNSVTIIKEGSFAGNKITELIIPDSVITIEGWAFESNNIKSLNLGNSITDIGVYAFVFNQIISLNIPNSLTTIAEHAFSANGRISIYDSVSAGGLNFNG